MYNLDNNKKLFPKNIFDLIKKFENKNNNLKINTIKNIENYFKKLKK